MTVTVTSESALMRAIDQAGSQSAFARLLGVAQQTVSDWVNKRRPLPAEHVLLVERETGVPKEQLRPDIYPPELTSAATPTPDRLEGVRQ